MHNQANHGDSFFVAASPSLQSCACWPALHGLWSLKFWSLCFEITVPHFTTLASFVSRHADEIEALFEQVLLVCHEQGLLGNELGVATVDKKHQIVIDGRSPGTPHSGISRL
ncbi:hypothetical protein [Halomonas sp. SpR8]|uniref:hypothetical protein n=1 Tax=Halomonas sp. SpR8 TaxID=3050463 RepID=UPI0027E5BB77|nr:hypothetical protein [Halomonas sp. SpR8]MDQ7729231.1 hypothetical protein [Halomonas sp. SpR8]